ncbi:uncharacterized protein BKCO1_7700014 [Diplodia corticola]|uniref:Uncharacterized protein n=1 Tax=Diplodia corticola TaxID=236234 RepID=A0A1J9RAW2_9PEZI|nr:uncharacterized protein BKCO1_7700014 [Diplodia corticola]OJD29563.1 hypothetical protein BKCO1_7700014 [Diplodia corticola]
MRDDESLARLLTVLRERRVPLTRDDVQWAFDSVKTQNDAVSWVEEYLHSDTLLSKEELALYETLCAQDEEVKDLVHVPEIQPFQDNGIRDAIEALEASTTAIDEQTKSLEVQMDALLELRTQNAEPNNAVRRKLDDRRRKITSEKGQLDFDIEGLKYAINDRILSSQKQTKSAASSLTAVVNDRFTSDDRMLSAVSKLSSKLEPPSEEQFDFQTINKWCTSLVSFRAAGIRVRVERIFQETLTNDDYSEEARQPADEALAEKEELKEELETLHSEITSVAQMGVEQELRRPIFQTLEQGQGQQKRLQIRWLDYILASLEYMTNRLHHLTMHAADLRAYTAALSEISKVFSATLPPPPPTRSSPSKQAAVARARAKSIAATPVQLSAATQQLLRQLDITLPPVAETRPLQALAQAVMDRQSRLLAHIDSSQSTAVQSVSEAVSSGAVEVQEMLAALFANSEYRTVKVTKREVEEGLEAVEKGIGEVSSIMPELQEKMNVAGGDAKSKRRERAFVGRWGAPTE